MDNKLTIIEKKKNVYASFFLGFWQGEYSISFLTYDRKFELKCNKFRTDVIHLGKESECFFFFFC